MTVTCLSVETKDQVTRHYASGGWQQKELAKAFNTSERTINRVLIEAGLLTPVAQLKADAYNVMQVLKKHGIDPSKLDQVLSCAENITTHEVQTFLLTLTDTEVSELFYNAAMAKFECNLSVVMAQTKHTQEMESFFDDLPF